MVIDKGSKPINFSTGEVNELLMLLGQQRTKDLSNTINTSLWKDATDEQKINILRKINGKYSTGYITLEDGNRKVFEWYKRRQEMINQKLNEKN